MDLMIVGWVAVALGIVTFWRAEQTARQVREQMADGEDRFFEEQRSYRAYPFQADPKKLRVIGILLMLMGIAALALYAWVG